MWVLGCGPSLNEVCIPPHVFTIGVNTSYLKHWSPIYTTCDSAALRRDYGRAAALHYISGIRPEKVDLHGRKDIEYSGYITIARSGTLAYWAALKLFKADFVKLVGFDMDWKQGHFNEEEVKPVDYDAHTKPVLGFWLEEFQCPTKIWRDGWVDLEKVL